jgi:gluconolactonase
MIDFKANPIRSTVAGFGVAAATLLLNACAGKHEPAPVTPPVDRCQASASALAAKLASAVAVPVAALPTDDFTTGFSILEGPVWLNGQLYLSQINATEEAPPPARLLRFDASSGALVVVDAKSGSNGLELAPNGRLAAARHVDGTVSYIDPANPGVATPIAAQFEGQRFNSPNDLTFHSNGTLFFTDPDWQSPKPAPQSAERVYRVAPGKAVEAVAAALKEPTAVAKPNGVALSLDEKRLYVGGTNGLFRFTLDADAQVLGTDAVRLPVTDEGVDGMTLDCAGNLLVTTGNRLLALDANEQVLGSVVLPRNPTNVELGGPDGTSLFITTLETTVEGTPSKPLLYRLELGNTAPARAVAAP